MARDGLDHGVELAADVEARAVAVEPQVADAREVLELARVDRRAETHVDLAVGALAHLGHGLDGDEPPVADDPHAVTDALDLVEVVRGEEDRAAALALLG